MAKPPPKKENILALIKLIKENAAFVNETPRDIARSESLGRLDTLTATAGHAMEEMLQFIGAFEELKSKYADLSSDAMLAHQALQSHGINSHDLASATELLIGRLAKANDVLANIAYNLPAEKCKEVAFGFIGPVSEIAKDPIKHGTIIGGSTGPFNELKMPANGSELTGGSTTPLDTPPNIIALPPPDLNSPGAA